MNSPTQLGNEFFAVPVEYVIATITDIRQETATEWGRRIVVEVAPLGETTPRLIFFNAMSASSRRSKWQRWLKNLRDIGISTDSAQAIVSKIIKFRLVENVFTNPDTGEERTFDEWRPEKVYSSQAEALAELAEMPVKVEQKATEPEKYPGGLSADEFENATTAWAALSQNVVLFIDVAEKSWPHADVAALVEYLQRRENQAA